MNTLEIKRLLEKYYEGNCSDNEEQLLRIYFRGTGIPPELEPEREIFAHYDSSLSIPEPTAGFEERIIMSVASAESKKGRSSINRYIFAYMSAAAAIMLLIGSWFFFIRRTEPADTFRDPAIAYNETVKILYRVSARLNSGMDAMEPFKKVNSLAVMTIGRVGRSTEMINDNLKALGYFQKAMDIVSSPLEINSYKK